MSLMTFAWLVWTNWKDILEKILLEITVIINSMEKLSFQKFAYKTKEFFGFISEASIGLSYMEKHKAGKLMNKCKLKK